MVQNWSEDVPGCAAETGAQGISSGLVGQDRLAEGTCKQITSMRAYGQRELLIPESNSIITKIVVLARMALSGYSGLFWIPLTCYQRGKHAGDSVKGVLSW